MTVLVSDSFNRANSTTTLGMSDSYNGGTPQTWLNKGGNWGILNNQAYLVTDNNLVDPKVAYFDVGQSDVSITVTIPVVNDNFSCAFRLDTTVNTGIIVHTGTIKIQSFSGESYTTIADSGIWAVNGDVIKVTIQGTSITVFRNGTQILTGTSAINQTSTKHGLGNYQKSGATGTFGMWDNFVIEDLVTGGTTTYTGSGTLLGTSSLTPTGKIIYKGSGTVQGTSNISSVEKSILKALGTLQGSSSLTSSETYTTQTGTTYTGGGTLQGSSNVSGNEHYLYKASGTQQGLSNLSSGETLILFTGNTYSASGTIQGFSTLSASEKIIYEEISTAIGYSDSSVHEIVTLLASGIAQGYSNVLLIDKTEVIAQVTLIGKQRIEVTLIGKQKLDTIMQGKQRISINLKGVMK